MPYASAKQANLMRAVAHSPSFAKKVGIPQSVGQKFETHKAQGGIMKESPAMVKKEMAFMKKAGAPKSMIAHEKAEAKGYAKGGMAKFKGVKGSSVKSGLDAGNKSADGIAQRGKTRGDNIVMKKRGGKC